MEGKNCGVLLRGNRAQGGVGVAGSGWAVVKALATPGNPASK